MNTEDLWRARPSLCAQGEYSLGADTASKQKKETASLSNPLQVMWMTADNLPIRKKQVSSLEVCITKISLEPSSTCLQTWDCRGIVLWIITSLVGESGQVSPSLWRSGSEMKWLVQRHTSGQQLSWVSIQRYCGRVFQELLNRRAWAWKEIVMIVMIPYIECSWCLTPLHFMLNNI